MAVRQKQGEDFSDEKVELVIQLLEKGETKKSCCDVLGISYNTARLAKIIAAHIDKKEFLVKQKKILRGTPVSKADCAYIVQAYLNSEAISNIADSVYRSDSTVKNILVRYGVPFRKPGSSYFDPVFIDTDTPDNYIKGDLVFSARYNSLAEIMKNNENGVYKICVLGSHQRYANQPYYELADLRKVQSELGIKGEWEKETAGRAWQAVVDGQKRKKEKDYQ